MRNPTTAENIAEINKEIARLEEAIRKLRALRDKLRREE